MKFKNYLKLGAIYYFLSGVVAVVFLVFYSIGHTGGFRANKAKMG